MNPADVPDLPPPHPGMLEREPLEMVSMTDHEDITDCVLVYLFDDGNHRVWHTINGEPWVEGLRPEQEASVENMIAHVKREVSA